MTKKCRQEMQPSPLYVRLLLQTQDSIAKLCARRKRGEMEDMRYRIVKDTICGRVPQCPHECCLRTGERGLFLGSRGNFFGINCTEEACLFCELKGKMGVRFVWRRVIRGAVSITFRRALVLAVHTCLSHLHKFHCSLLLYTSTTGRRSLLIEHPNQPQDAVRHCGHQDTQQTPDEAAAAPLALRTRRGCGP